MNLLIEELDWSREEGRRLERVEVGKICGCKSCLCCEELKRDTEQRKAVRELVLARRI